jgi:hypothetical protein
LINERTGPRSIFLAPQFFFGPTRLIGQRGDHVTEIPVASNVPAESPQRSSAIGELSIGDRADPGHELRFGGSAEIIESLRRRCECVLSDIGDRLPFVSAFFDLIRDMPTKNFAETFSDGTEPVAQRVTHRPVLNTG